MKRLLPAGLGAVFACAISLQASFARADQPELVQRYQDDRRPPGAVRGKLFLAGAAVTSAFYAPVLGASFIWDEHPAAAQMRIPVAGPWLGFSKTKLCNARPDDSRCNNFLVVTGAVLLVLDGIGQAGGVGLMLESIFLPTGPSRAVRAETDEARLLPSHLGPSISGGSEPRSPFTLRSGDFRISPVPTVGGDSDVGLSFIGNF